MYYFIIKHIKKIILTIIAITIVISTIIFFNIFDLKKDQNGFSLKIEEDKKPLVKKIVTKISGKVYEEATEHNPEGDRLPDWIDDKIKEGVN